MGQTMIGILAGMGPRSSSPFLELVLDQCQIQYGAQFDLDYPPIMMYSLPTPFYVDKEMDHAVMKGTIIEGLKKLAATGVDFIAMPCNSAHIYFADLKSSIEVPLLNIVEETLKCLPGKKQRVTILAAEATFNSEVYQQGIIAKGHEFAFKSSWQPKVDQMIKLIKAKEEMKNIIKYWQELLDEVAKLEIESLIIACTDLTMLNIKNGLNLNIYDSAEALAKSVVKNYICLQGNKG
ncbi:MAG: aspartate/glutamate racemase family protein [Peptococcaceae bacterium]